MHTTEIAEGVDKYEITKVKYPNPQTPPPWQNKINRKDIRKEPFFLIPCI